MRLYKYYDEAGVKRDAGGDLRTALLGALLPIADTRDQTLAERAIGTYEFLPPKREECAGGLRAAGLVLLHNLDPLLTSYQGARLLVDEYISPMSGEAAVSAARLLESQGQLLPLYSYLFAQHPHHAEVEAECLRNLSRAPASIIPRIAQRGCLHMGREVATAGQRDPRRPLFPREPAKGARDVSVKECPGRH